MSDFSSRSTESLTDRISASTFYRPIGLWTGRLILPPVDRRLSEDAVGFEIHNAAPDYQHLIGKVVTLKWSQAPEVQAFVRRVTCDIHFNAETEKSRQFGNLHPDRLNGRPNVGPLESLAGARSADDVTVLLTNPSVEEGENPALAIATEPIQITGKIYALVTVVRRDSLGSDRFLVRHYNPLTQKFDGLEEIIRIPQVPPDRRGIPRSTNQDLELSPVNSTGWYIYGDRESNGTFVVQALEPRAAMQLQTNCVRLGLDRCLNYINREHWQNTPAKKGTVETCLLAPFEQKIESAIESWREGDIGIVLHLFGGIGGAKAENMPIVVTGHFSYGVAQVVTCPFTGELRFDIDYWQVYGHNPDSIISGLIKWQSYMGDLQRGWLGNRPISDIVVKFPAITQPYNFDGIKLSPLTEFSQQLQVMTARYRTGDGDGAAVVTPATSCVQDSNQALYLTIKDIEAEISSNSQIQAWLYQHPHTSGRWRFEQLMSLGRSLEQNLFPFGFVRSDWQPNSDKLAGIGSYGNPVTTLIKSVTTWRTILPRRAHDDLAKIFLKHGSLQWVIRTNQVGGYDPEIAPRPATTLF